MLMMHGSHGLPRPQATEGIATSAANYLPAGQRGMAAGIEAPSALATKVSCHHSSVDAME